MKLVLAYMVICSTSQIGLEGAMENALAKGWKPQGGVSVSESRPAYGYGTTGDVERSYCQAVTKLEPATPTPTPTTSGPSTREENLKAAKKQRTK